jgi:hypothetical protein
LPEKKRRSWLEAKHEQLGRYLRASADGSRRVRVNFFLTHYAEHELPVRLRSSR